MLFAHARAGVTALARLGEGLVFDGAVTKAIPTDASGAIKPYVVFSAGTGDVVGDEALCGTPSWDAVDWRFQTRCFGPTADHTRRLAWDVTQALTGLRIRDGLVKPDQDSFRVDGPLLDPGVTPARFFLPLSWRLITT
jgi:hypothetical protein